MTVNFSTISNLVLPKLIKQLDERLIIQQPFLWSTGLHYVVFYSLILFVMYGVYVLSIPPGYKWGGYFLFGFYVSIFVYMIGVMVWLYFLAKYDIRKSFAVLGRFSDYLYILSILVGLLVFLASWFYATMLYSDEVRLKRYIELGADNWLAWAVTLLVFLYYFLLLQSFIAFFSLKRFLFYSVISLVLVFVYSFFVVFFLGGIGSGSSGVFVFFWLVVPILFLVVGFRYILSIDRREEKAVLVWYLCMAYLPIATFLVLLLIEEEFYRYSDDFYDFTLVPVLVLQMMFFAWQRKHIYRLYALPR